jgi:hypothetical protein
MDPLVLFLLTCTVMDQIQIHRTTHKTALLNCSSYLVLMLIGLGILNLEVEAMETIL